MLFKKEQKVQIFLRSKMSQNVIFICTFFSKAGLFRNFQNQSLISNKILSSKIEFFKEIFFQNLTRRKTFHYKSEAL